MKAVILATLLFSGSMFAAVYECGAYKAVGEKNAEHLFDLKVDTASSDDSIGQLIPNTPYAVVCGPEDGDAASQLFFCAIVELQGQTIEKAVDTIKGGKGNEAIRAIAQADVSSQSLLVASHLDGALYLTSCRRK